MRISRRHAIPILISIVCTRSQEFVLVLFLTYLRRRCPSMLTPEGYRRLDFLVLLNSAGVIELLTRFTLLQP